MLGAFAVFSAAMNVLSLFCWLVLAILTGIFARGSSRFLLCAALVLHAALALPGLVQSFGVRFSRSVSSMFSTVSNVGLWVELLLVVLGVVLDAPRRKEGA